jgi:hypothetical protein
LADRGQGVHRRGHGGGRGDVLERQVPAQRVRVDHRHLARAEQRLALGGEPELPAPVGQRVVERLDAERVTCAEQLPGPRVPDGEGEHAAQPAERLAALGGEGLEQQLGV